MKVLLYFLYGSVAREYHLELSYSILSAAKFLKEDPADVRVVFASDSANLRPDLPAEQLLFDAQTIHEWQLGGTFAYAAKQYVLSHALDLFGVPTVLLDSDTIFHKHPKHLFERIGPGRSLMNESGSTLADERIWLEWEALIKKSGGCLSGYKITPSTVMHNSGVVGVDPHDAHLMKDAIAMMQDIVKLSDVPTAEQLATSIVCSEHTVVSSCTDIIEHYWGYRRPFYHYQMAHLFPAVLGGGMIDGRELALPSLRKILPLKFSDRAITRLKRFQLGSDRGYRFAYLAYRSALSCRHQDQALANAWGATALNALLWATEESHPAALANFSNFGPENLDLQDWMTPQLRQRWQKYWAEFA